MRLGKKVIVDNSVIANNIKHLLIDRDCMQIELANAISMQQQTLSNKLNCIRSFTLRDLARIADVFHVSVDYLLGRDDQELAPCAR